MASRQGKLLTLTTSEALEHKVAELTADTVDAALAAAGLPNAEERPARQTRAETLLLGSPNAASTEDLQKTGHLSLGHLKGNVGPQNYTIPAGTDLARYRAVAVWCRRFGVNFTTAQFETRFTDRLVAGSTRGLWRGR